MPLWCVLIQEGQRTVWYPISVSHCLVRMAEVKRQYRRNGTPIVAVAYRKLKITDDYDYDEPEPGDET